jgi:hypothetical protein
MSAPPCHALAGDYDGSGWPTLCGGRTTVGGVEDPGPGRSLRDAGVDCPSCLEFDVTPLRPR